MSDHGSDKDLRYYSSSAESEVTRPNRWQGAPSTWYSITEQERGLATSLDALRNRDLAVHLYAAHGLKRRAQEISEEYEFAPPKSWTAWPLPPGEVPREGDTVGEEDADEVYTLKMREKAWPSRELEDILVGVTLGFAKERFEGREWEEDLVHVNGGQGERFDEDLDMATNLTAGVDELEYRGQQAQVRAEMEDVDGEENPAIMEEPPVKIFLKPVVSTDDERSRQLLRPSIRHTLSKLDEVFMALHHAREACCRYTKSEAITDDEGRGASARHDPVTPVKKPRGRPRKFANLADRSRGTVDVEEKYIVPAQLLRTKTTHLGRPKKNYDRLEGETHEAYIIRIARIQKKPLPSFAPPLEYSPSPSPSPKKSGSPIKKSSKQKYAENSSKKLELRDWSEVLGTAALVGFSPGVIERATRRCSKLFGEGMVMRTIAEAPFGEQTDSVKIYQPEKIPDFDKIDPTDISDEEGDESDESEMSTAPKTQTCFCPLKGCGSKFQGFRDKYSLKRHLKGTHGIKDDEIEDFIILSDEEMDGAVHVDRFLRPLKSLGGRSGRISIKKKDISSADPESSESSCSSSSEEEK